MTQALDFQDAPCSLTAEDSRTVGQLPPAYNARLECKGRRYSVFLTTFAPSLRSGSETVTSSTPLSFQQSRGSKSDLVDLEAHGLVQFPEVNRPIPCANAGIRSRSYNKPTWIPVHRQRHWFITVAPGYIVLTISRLHDQGTFPSGSGDTIPKARRLALYCTRGKSVIIHVGMLMPCTL